MGVYLNSTSSYGLFRREYTATYYVDKTEILKELVPLVELDDEIEEADFKQGKGVDSKKVFRNLKVSKYDWYEKHLNKHNVIHIVFSEMPKNCNSYENISQDLKKV